MLNARIEIDTSELPYKINRTKPTFLDPYFQESIQWTIFCDNIDVKLEPFETIKAAWMVMGALFTLVLIGIVVAIVLRFMGVIDESGDGKMVAASLFIALVLAFGIYYVLIKVFVLRPLNKLEKSIDDYCIKTAATWHNVGFKFEKSSNMAIYWDSDFKAWINVATTDAVE